MLPHGYLDASRSGFTGRGSSLVRCESGRQCSVMTSVHVIICPSEHETGRSLSVGLPSVSWYRSQGSPGFGVEFHSFATNRSLSLSSESRDTVLRIHGVTLLLREHSVRELAGDDFPLKTNSNSKTGGLQKC